MGSSWKNGRTAKTRSLCRMQMGRRTDGKQFLQAVQTQSHITRQMGGNGRMRRCLVCLSTHNVNPQGRCSLCQVSYDAARGGVSYGQYQAILYRPPEEGEAEPEIPELEIPEEEQFKPGFCRQCGKPFPAGYRQAQRYCSVQCKNAARKARECADLDRRGRGGLNRRIGNKDGAAGVWIARELY